MIPVTAEVEAVMNADAAWCADLFTFTLKSGVVLRYTSADIDVTWGGNTWLSRTVEGAPLIERGEITYEPGLTVDQLEITIHTDETMAVSGLPWPHAIRVGLLNDATVEVWRAVSLLGEPVAGIIPRFVGKVGPCNPGRMRSTITVESLLAYLSAPVPRNVYQPSCSNTVYDDACGLNRAAHETVVTVTSVSLDSTTIDISGASLTVDQYLGGFARFVGTVGGNVNQQVTIKSNSAGQIVLLYPFPASLLIGQQLALAPGCPKTTTACNGFGNIVRFRGHPHVPVPETAI